MEFEPREEMESANHKVNHIMYSKSGGKFVFMHRWIGEKGKFSRLYVANEDGSKLRLLLDDRMISHYQWKNDELLIVWGRTKDKGDKYYLINVETGVINVVGDNILDKNGDGHPSFANKSPWIVTDTYPDKSRIRSLILFNYDNNKIVEIGSFFAPWSYDGEQRCDLHPRWSPDDRFISVDSAHEGIRKNYIIDISKIVTK